MTSAMKNSTFAIVLAPDATPVKPKKPATTEMMKKMMAHLIMPASLILVVRSPPTSGPRRGSLVARPARRNGRTAQECATDLRRCVEAVGEAREARLGQWSTEGAFPAAPHASRQCISGLYRARIASVHQRLVPRPVRPRAFLAEPLPLVGLVFLVVALEEHPLRVVLRGEDVRRDPVEEPAVVGDDQRAA